MNRKSRIERFMGYASKAEMLRIDMALLVSLALNVLSGNRSEERTTSNP